jgi:5-methylcytosine-specific restriction protein A
MPKPLDKRERNREYDARRRQSKPWRKLYGTARWQALRAEQLTRSPLCERCSTDDRPVIATVVHHKERHHGDEGLFFGGELASLCKDCHDIDERNAEMGFKARQIVDAEGWPVG